MLIRWSETAKQDLKDILQYFIDEKDRETGQEVVDRLFLSTRRLEQFPESGRQGKKQGTREVVPKRLPYLVVYKIMDDESIAILSVVHTAKSQDEE